MDANDDTVRSLADLLVRKVSVGEVSLDTDAGGSIVEADVRPMSRVYSRTDSVHHAKTQLTSQLMRSDAEGLEVEPSIIAETNYQRQELSTRLPRCFHREILLKLFLVLLFVCIVSSLVVIFHFYNHQQYQDMLGRRILFDEVSRVLDVEDIERKEVLRGHLGMNLPEGALPYNCAERDDAELCLKWKKKAQVKIQHHTEGDINCYDIRWSTLDNDSTPKDCFELDWGEWYGGGLLENNLWPLNNATVPTSAFVTSSPFDKRPWGSVIERYWLTSSAVAIHVDSGSLLHVSINENDRHFCLSSFHEESALSEDKPSLNYTICVGLDLKDTHRVMVDQFMSKPSNVGPQEELFKAPVWSTWANMKNAFDQDQLTAYVHDINDRGYTQSLLIIDDGWQSQSGDFSFDPERFPDASEMLQGIKESGFNISLWVHPYFAISSNGFQDIVAYDIAVKDSGGVHPGLTRWWNGPHTTLTSTRPISGVLDLSLKGQTWLRLQLEAFLTNNSVDCFYFWGGEATILPYEAVFTGKEHDDTEYTAMYSQFAAQLDHNNIVSSAYLSQSNAHLIRLSSTASTWESLRNVIPKILTLGIMGYPFVIADSIGGGGWPFPPTEELYVRWMQLASFLPIMHFSKPPHDYDSKVIKMAFKYIRLHATLIAPRISSLVQESIETLSPVIRPLWWIDNSHVSHTIDSEFLVGDWILVAPVLWEGASTRDVYIPSGKWTDALTNEVHEGPVWINDYPVQFNEVPYFLKV